MGEVPRDLIFKGGAPRFAHVASRYVRMWGLSAPYGVGPGLVRGLVAGEYACERCSGGWGRKRCCPMPASCGLSPIFASEWWLQWRVVAPWGCVPCASAV